MNPRASGEALIVHRYMPASPARVFAAWTDPDRLMKWWGPKEVECTHAEVDLVIDGAFRLANTDPSGDTVWISGHYKVIDPPHRLEYTWAVEPVDASLPTEYVAIDFAAAGAGTDITITHSRITSAEAKAGHEYGWTGCLDGLTSLLTSTT